MDDRDVIKAFVNHLRANGYPSIKIDRWPEDENRNTPEIDAIAGPFAIEHTSLDIICNQRRDSDWFMQAIGGIGSELKDITFRLRIWIEYDAVAKGQNWSKIRQAIKTWIVSDASRLTDGRHVIEDIAGVPFRICVFKHSDRPPGVNVGRLGPPDDTLPSRIRMLFERKSEKLAKYHKSGKTTVLLVENYDLALINDQDMLKAIQEAYPNGLPESVDKIWYADTSIPDKVEFYNYTSELVRKENFSTLLGTKKPAKSEIALSTRQVEQEILAWEARLSEKENEASDLSLQIQDIKIAMNLFLGEYYSRVGIFYVKLDKLKLRIKEYEHRIAVAQGKKLTPENLESIEAQVDETFSQQRRKVDDLENEASESAQEYDKYLEQEKRKPFDEVFQQELKRIYRRLALKFHPDKAKDEKQARKFQKIFAAIAEAYKKGDLETLKKYMKQAEREERIARETSEEKLARLKNDYERVLDIIAKLQAELKELKTDETYKLKEKIDQAKKDGKDLLQKLAADTKEEIAENQARLDNLVAEYKDLIGDVAY